MTSPAVRPPLRQSLNPIGWLLVTLGGFLVGGWAVVVLLAKADAGLQGSDEICNPAGTRSTSLSGWDWRVDWFPTETVCWPRSAPSDAFVAHAHTEQTAWAAIALCLIAVGVGLVVAGRALRRTS